MINKLPLPPTPNEIVGKINEIIDDKQDVLTAGTDLEIIEGGTLHDLPEGYTELDFVETQGNRYIDTGISITENTELELDIQCLSPLGSKYISGRYIADMGDFYLYTGSAFQFAYACKYKNTSRARDLLRHIFKFYIKNGRSYINIDGAYNTDATTLSYMPTTTIIVAGSKSTPSYDIRTYQVTIRRDGTIIMQLIPCISDNNVVGFYDVVGRNFFAGEGKGNFIAGDVTVGHPTINFTNESGFLTEINSSDVTTALGYTPYNSSNPSGYITSTALTGYATESYVTSAVSGKQDTLVSGTNIKTINNQSLLGSGNIDIQGGGSSYTPGTGIVIENDVISVDGQITTEIDSEQVSEITLASVATSGDYADLSNKPVVDQTYNGISTNAQSGVAIAGVLGDIETLLHNVNSGS